MYPAAYLWRAHATPILRTGIALLIGTVVVLAFPGGASAGATDDYPIPHRAIEPTCTVSRSSPRHGISRLFYYERYIIGMRNRPPDVQQGAIDRIHWFFSLSPADRRACSEDLATNIYAEPMAQRWGNWAKVFFNNKGVVAGRPITAPTTRLVIRRCGTGKQLPRGFVMARRPRMLRSAAPLDQSRR
jgi:hypothetical protein